MSKYLKPEAYKESKHKRVVKDYLKLVTDDENLIGLSGHQPTLIKIREAWENGELEHNTLLLVLNNLAIELEGEEESYSSIKTFSKEWCNIGIKADAGRGKSEIVKSIQEQADIVSAMFKPKKKASSAKKSKPEPKIVSIDVNALPESLRHLV